VAENVRKTGPAGMILEFWVNREGFVIETFVYIIPIWKYPVEFRRSIMVNGKFETVRYVDEFCSRKSFLFYTKFWGWEQLK